MYPVVEHEVDEEAQARVQGVVPSKVEEISTQGAGVEPQPEAEERHRQLKISQRNYHFDSCPTALNLHLPTTCERMIGKICQALGRHPLVWFRSNTIDKLYDHARRALRTTVRQRSPLQPPSAFLLVFA